MTLLIVTRTLPGYLVQLFVLLVLLGVKLGRLAEERRRGVELEPRRPTVAAAALLILGLVLGVLGKFAPSVTELVDAHPLQYVQNIVTAATYFSLWFLYAPAGGLRAPAVRRQIALFVGFSIVLAFLTGVMWARGLPNDDSTPTLSAHSTTAAFYLIALGFFAYLDLSVAVPTLRYLVRARGWLRVGLVLLALAASMHALAVLSRFGAVVTSMAVASRPALLYEVASPLYNLGNPILVLGLATPLLAGRGVAVGRWFTRRHRYSRMRTLASTALAVFPELALPGVADDLPDGTGPGAGVERGRFPFRYVGRITQCRDAINRAEGFGQARVASEDTLPAERFWIELLACGVTAERSYSDLDSEAQAYAEISGRLHNRERARRTRDRQPVVPGKPGPPE